MLKIDGDCILLSRQSLNLGHHISMPSHSIGLFTLLIF